jgi:alkaline phosphatase D
MPGGRRGVQWQVATDDRFRRVVASGRTLTGPELGHAVHVELRGLRPGRAYFYRFRTGRHLSPTGRTRTAPHPAVTPPSLTMCFASCAQWEHGFFTAYRRMAQDEPDLVLHLGDYLYEYSPHTVPAKTGDIRVHAGPETADLAGYRQRHAQYKTDPDLQLLHGGLATFHMLDTRQHRDDQACGDGTQDCAAADDPGRSLLGHAQEAWLADGFGRSTQVWDVLGQQVVFSQLDVSLPGPGDHRQMDAWDGYAACRDRVVSSWQRSGVRNPVVLTGDVHDHYAAEVLADWDDPASEVVATELVTTSITSNGDGEDPDDGRTWWSDQNPHVPFWTDLRGYVRTRFTPTELTADFRCLPRVSVPDQPAFTRASYVVEEGRPGLNRTAWTLLSQAS